MKRIFNSHFVYYFTDPQRILMVIFLIVFTGVSFGNWLYDRSWIYIFTLLPLALYVIASRRSAAWKHSKKEFEQKKSTHNV